MRRPRASSLAGSQNGSGTLAAVGCETEPVSKNDEFRAFAQRVLETAARGTTALSRSRRSGRSSSAKIGENVAVVGTARFEAVNGAKIDSYVHPPANKLGVLVQVRGGSDALARKIAMHIAASSPRWIAP